MGDTKRFNSCGERDSGFGGSESAKLLVEPEYECGCGCRTCKCGVCEGETTERCSNKEDEELLCEDTEDSVQCLLNAATDGNLARVRKLLSEGVDANSRSTGGRPVLTTLLVSPTVRRRPRRLPALTAALLASGADPGRPEPLRAMTALHAAARLAAGYGPSAGSASGQTNIASRCVAFRCATLRVLRLLTDTADESSINGQDHQSRTPLHVLAAHGCMSEEPYEILFSKGADPTIRNYRNETALLELLDRPGCGCSNPSGSGVEVVRLLAGSTKTGRNGEKAIHIPSRYLESPLHVAARRGSDVAVGLLLENGADPSTVDLRGDTPLHVAAARGHARVAKLLVEADSSAVQVVNVEGSSPLHLAVESGFVQVVEVLLEAPGCDARIPSSAGLTAIELAEQAFRHSSQPHLLTLLQRHLNFDQESSVEGALGLVNSDSPVESPQTDLNGFDSSNLHGSSEKCENIEKEVSTGETTESAPASPLPLKLSFVGRFLRRSVSTTSDRVLCQIPSGSSEKLFRSPSKDLNSLWKKLCLSDRVSQ